MTIKKVKQKIYLVFDRYPQAKELGVFAFSSKQKASKWMKMMNDEVDEIERNFLNLKENEFQFYGPFEYELKLNIE